MSLLTYRDIYLEKRVAAIASAADFALKVVEIYRDYLYDTIVLYTAVFPREDPLTMTRLGTATVRNRGDLS